MVSRLTKTWLFVWVALAVFAASAWAQVPANSGLDYSTPKDMWEDGPAAFAKDQPGFWHGIWPFKPTHVGSNAQPFAPAQTSGYGNGPRPHIGFFASYERAYWSLSKPKTAVVGSETAAPPVTNGFVELDIPAINSLDTGKFTANGGWGNRWEVGYIDNDNYGWMVSILDHIQQSQYHTDFDVSMQFDDPGNLLLGSVLIGPFLFDIGKMAVQFDEVTQQQITTINGVDLSRFYRTPRLHHGGYLDVIYGVRWFQLYDAYIVHARNFGINQFFINPLEDSNWSNVVQNNLVGPEIGLRWFRQNGRWTTSIDARFFAAANFQNVKMRTELGNEISGIVQTLAATEGVVLPRQFLGLGTDQHDFATTFAPTGELRVNAAYNVTSKVALKVGYTGMIAGGITRASNRIDYSQNKLITILQGNEHQAFWVNGLTFGVEVNR
jgi:hypothetical protein